MSAALDQALADQLEEVTDETTVYDGAVAFINSTPGLIQAAYDAGLKAGATPAQLQVLADTLVGMKANKAKIVKALTDNTPTPPPTP